MATTATKRRRGNELSAGQEIIAILTDVSEKLCEAIPLLRDYAASMNGEMKNEINTTEAKVRGARMQIGLAELSVRYAEEEE